MDRLLVTVCTLVAVGLVVGCGDASRVQSNRDSGAHGSNAKQSGRPGKTLSPQQQPVVQAAERFLDAVIQGDSRHALEAMTANAMAQIQSSGKAFAPPGLESAKYRLGEVRLPSPEQAIVQCFLTDASNPAAPQEEMCCMLKLADGRWGVSGIAFQTSPKQPLFILDFERPSRSGPAGQTVSDSLAEQHAQPNTPAVPGSSTPTTTLRTAQQPESPIGR